MRVDREVTTDDGVITVQVEACKHGVPLDADVPCRPCEHEAWSS